MLVCLLLLTWATTGLAQNVPPDQVDANALVRRAIRHRLDASRNHHPLEYVLHEKDEKGETTKVVIETKDGDVDRVIARNGKPLDAEAERAQVARLDEFARRPDLQMQRFKNEQKVRARVDRFSRLIPDALAFRMEGVEACPTGECYRLRFQPNPKFQPQDLEARLFRAVSGEAWIDRKQERLDKIDAHFISSVEFGFGILGRVNKGGTVMAEQTEIDGGEWVLTQLKMDVSGRLLLVKSFVRQLSEEVRDARPVPTMGYRQAIEILKQGSWREPGK